MADIATLGIQVKMDGVAQANKGLNDLDKNAGKAERSSKLLGAAFSGLAGPLVATTAAVFGLQRSITTIAGFEHSMSQVSAITRASTADLERMRDVAKDLGASTEFSASQAADGLKFLGQAGFTASEAVAAIPAVLDLATASAMGLAEAADISSNIMSGFGLQANEAAAAADVLAAAASRSNTDVVQLGDAMKFAAPVAASLKISMSDTASAIGVLSDAGIQGSQAGTGLRAVLATLVKPAKEGQRALAAMGLTIKDVNPETKSLAEIFQLLRSRGLNAQAAMMLFGREAASAGLALASSSKHLGDLSDEMRDVNGEAKRMADTMRDNLRGDLDNVASAAEGLIIAIGEAGLTAALRAAAQATTSVLGFFTSMTEYADVAVYSVGALATAFALKYTPAIYAAVTATGVWTAALAALRIAIAATGIGAIVIAIGGAIAALMRAKEATGSWGGAFELLGDRVGLISKGIGRAFDGASDMIKSAWYSAMAAIVKSTEMAMSAVYGALGLTFKGFGKLSENLRDKGISAFENAGDAFRDSGELLNKAIADFNREQFGPPMPPGMVKDTEDAVKALVDLSDASSKAADAYAELLRSAQQRVQQMEQEVQLVGMNSIAADVLRMKLDVLHQAQEKGLKLSQAQKDQLNAQADAYGRAAQKVAELTLMEDARFARAQLGRSAIEQQIASDLKNAGIEMDSVAGQAYASYAKLTDAISTAKTEAKSFASSFVSDLLNGKSATESLIGALKKLGDKLIDMALDEMINGLFKNLLGILGGGGGGGFMGASFFPPAPAIGGGGIGLFADGGISNKPAIFGEAGPEAAVPLPDGRSIPVTLNGGAGSGGGGNTINNYNNFTGTQREFEQFQKFVMERDRQFDARAQNAVRKGSKKNVGF